jgi:hypothetical protein
MYVIKHRVTKMYEGLEVQTHTFLSPAADGGDGLIHSPIVYTSGKSVKHWWNDSDRVKLKYCTILCCAVLYCTVPYSQDTTLFTAPF